MDLTQHPPKRPRLFPLSAQQPLHFAPSSIVPPTPLPVAATRYPHSALPPFSSFASPSHPRSASPSTSSSSFSRSAVPAKLLPSPLLVDYSTPVNGGLDSSRLHPQDRGLQPHPLCPAHCPSRSTFARGHAFDSASHSLSFWSKPAPIPPPLPASAMGSRETPGKRHIIDLTDSPPHAGAPESEQDSASYLLALQLQAQFDSEQELQLEAAKIQELQDTKLSHHLAISEGLYEPTSNSLWHEEEDAFLARKLHDQFYNEANPPKQTEASSSLNGLLPQSDMQLPRQSIDIFPHVSALNTYRLQARNVACSNCGAKLVQSHADMADLLALWVDGKAFMDDALKCPTCFARTCGGCGFQTTPPAPRPRPNKPEDHLWCCEFQRLLVIWILLSTFEHQRRSVIAQSKCYTQHEIAGPATAAPHLSRQPRGVGYGGREHDHHKALHWMNPFSGNPFSNPGVGLQAAKPFHGSQTPTKFYGSQTPTQFYGSHNPSTPKQINSIAASPYPTPTYSSSRLSDEYDLGPSQQQNQSTFGKIAEMKSTFSKAQDLKSKLKIPKRGSNPGKSTPPYVSHHPTYNGDGYVQPGYPKYLPHPSSTNLKSHGDMSSSLASASASNGIARKTSHIASTTSPSPSGGVDYGISHSPPPLPLHQEPWNKPLAPPTQYGTAHSIHPGAANPGKYAQKPSAHWVVEAADGGPSLMNSEPFQPKQSPASTASFQQSHMPLYFAPYDSTQHLSDQGSKASSDYAQSLASGAHAPHLSSSDGQHFYGGVNAADMHYMNSVRPRRRRHESVDYGNKEAEAACDRLTADVLDLLCQALPSCSYSTSFDLAPPTPLFPMVALGSIVDEAAELLRNDSIADATKRHKLYHSLIAFVSQLTKHHATVDIVLKERPEKSSRAKLMESSKGKAMEEGDGIEYVTSIAASMKNFVQQSRVMLRNARCNPREFLAEEAQEMLLLCDRMAELADEISVAAICLFEAPPTTKTVDKVQEWLEWQKANCMLDVPDNTMFSMHHYATEAKSTIEAPRGRMKRLMEESANLSTSLPPGVFVRYAASRPDVLKVLIVGPADTPYEGGLFEFDVLCPPNYPHEPPRFNFRTTGRGRGRFNPNLYEDGKVCLSLLNTWPGERWKANESTLLQVLVSLQSMVFCDQPYYNEPGFEENGMSADAARYNQRVQALTVRLAMQPWLVAGLKTIWSNVIREHFTRNKDAILTVARKWASTAGRELRTSEVSALENAMQKLKSQ